MNTAKLTHGYVCKSLVQYLDLEEQPKPPERSVIFRPLIKAYYVCLMKLYHVTDVYPQPKPSEGIIALLKRWKEEEEQEWKEEKIETTNEKACFFFSKLFQQNLLYYCCTVQLSGELRAGNYSEIAKSELEEIVNTSLYRELQSVIEEYYSPETSIYSKYPRSYMKKLDKWYDSSEPKLEEFTKKATEWFLKTIEERLEKNDKIVYDTLEITKGEEGKFCFKNKTEYCWRKK